MTSKCSFCGKWFESRHILVDTNNNIYCEECARERLPTPSKADMKKALKGVIKTISNQNPDWQWDEK